MRSSRSRHKEEPSYSQDQIPGSGATGPDAFGEHHNLLVRGSNPDVGILPGGIPSIDMTSDQFCEITANVATGVLSSVPPGYFSIAATLTTVPGATTIGLGLDAAAVFVQSGPAAEGIFSRGLEEICNIVADPPNLVPGISGGFSGGDSSSSGQGSNFGPSNSVDGGGHGHDPSQTGEGSQAAESRDSNGSGEWGGGGGEFNGAGASGSWNEGVGPNGADGSSGDWGGGGGGFNGGGASGSWDAGHDVGSDQSSQGGHGIQDNGFTPGWDPSHDFGTHGSGEFGWGSDPSTTDGGHSSHGESSGSGGPSHDQD